jgi:hypothetical protein
MRGAVVSGDGLRVFTLRRFGFTRRTRCLFRRAADFLFARADRGRKRCAFEIDAISRSGRIASCERRRPFGVEVLKTLRLRFEFGALPGERRRRVACARDFRLQRRFLFGFGAFEVETRARVVQGAQARVRLRDVAFERFDGARVGGEFRAGFLLALAFLFDLFETRAERL